MRNVLEKTAGRKPKKAGVGKGVPEASGGPKGLSGAGMAFRVTLNRRPGFVPRCLPVTGQHPRIVQPWLRSSLHNGESQRGEPASHWQQTWVGVLAQTVDLDGADLPPGPWMRSPSRGHRAHPSRGGCPLDSAHPQLQAMRKTHTCPRSH